MSRWAFHGHAIVSDDDRIAGPDGLTPESLRNDADWGRFQAALDAAAVTILGRLGHEANPNVRGRNRLVLSSGVRGIIRRDGAWWWNPAGTPLADALEIAAPQGGLAVVPGGRLVFDYFLKTGFDQFHLARAEGIRVPGGVPVFSGISSGSSAAECLAAGGLVADAPEALDPAANVSLTVWRRRA
ncbi:MAG: hypothetical protein ABJP31_02465 [Bauldia litoralis]|uniref:hypothetical protein n=1 Tax=Bauldia litoralis TaxID=665467 RepID=UPI0032994E80